MGEKRRAACASASVDDAGVTVSIGLASGVLEGDIDGAIEALIDAADVKLYEAERVGKDRVEI